MLRAGPVSAKDLVKEEVYWIAITNAQGPSIQAIRALNPHAIEQATASDKLRHKGLASGPLAGIPVLVNDSIDDAGLATSAGSIALQENLPAASSTIVGKLEAAGAIVMGRTNVTELGSAVDANL